ncbi:AAA family ATPase [Oceanithermus sp.]|uniref:AAA family ATPase n=1 Tax=Oceanithermus sp. TaxID=2268145 RepID=UPI0025F7947A|nr:AAA family ATPase [Oceanithermus sp.]
MLPRAHFQAIPGTLPLIKQPLLIVVGLTGVGKTSFTRALGWPTLPNRRELVDRYVLPRLGAHPEGLDRTERFRLTARWRAEHPGGLAEALAAAYVEPAWPLVFDGLRGEDEVRYARDRFERAYFVVLEAPARVRLERLLDRREGFDRVRVSHEEVARFRELASGVLAQQELDRLLERGYPLKTLIEKLKIVAEEQKHYHPEGPRRALAGCRRALFLDTARLDPEAAARRTRAWLQEVGR